MNVFLILKMLQNIILYLIIVSRSMGKTLKFIPSKFMLSQKVPKTATAIFLFITQNCVKLFNNYFVSIRKNYTRTTEIKKSYSKYIFLFLIR